MRTGEPKTPLLAILRHLTAEQREAFAARAGTPVSYLYHMAGCARKKPAATLVLNVAEASVWAHKQFGSPVVTARELTTMCDCVE